MVDLYTPLSLYSLDNSINNTGNIYFHSLLRDHRLLDEQGQITIHTPSQSMYYIINNWFSTFIYRFLSSSVGFFNLSGCIVSASYIESTKYVLLDNMLVWLFADLHSDLLPGSVIDKCNICKLHSMTRCAQLSRESITQELTTFV